MHYDWVGVFQGGTQHRPDTEDETYACLKHMYVCWVVGIWVRTHLTPNIWRPHFSPHHSYQEEGEKAEAPPVRTGVTPPKPVEGAPDQTTTSTVVGDGNIGSVWLKLTCLGITRTGL